MVALRVIDSWKDLVLAVAGYAWFILFIVVTLSASDRWGLVGGIAAAAVWIAAELFVVKAAVRMRRKARE